MDLIKKQLEKLSLEDLKLFRQAIDEMIENKEKKT